MKQLKNYLFKTYSNSFFPIFFILFIITSVVFLIKIATLTSVIQLDFFELITLYIYSIPKVLFYILPVTIFLSLIISIAKLSSDYELIVITSFGLNPVKLLRFLLPHLLIVTTTLLIISFILIPKAKYLNSEFINKKKSEAQFNINPSEFGQKFGEWFVYVNDKKKEIYDGIVLFKSDENTTNIIIADEAYVNKVKNSNLSLDLQTGRAFYINDNIKQIDFKTMILNNKIEEPEMINSFNDIINYWRNPQGSDYIERNFTFNIIYSIFPLISILLIISISYFNPRYDKNKSTVLAMTFAIIYVVIGHKSAKSYGINTLYIFPAVWLVLNYLYYRVKIKDYY